MKYYKLRLEKLFAMLIKHNAISHEFVYLEISRNLLVGLTKNTKVIHGKHVGSR
jgi:hypothetical protein